MKNLLSKSLAENISRDAVAAELYISNLGETEAKAVKLLKADHVLAAEWEANPVDVPQRTLTLAYVPALETEKLLASKEIDANLMPESGVVVVPTSMVAPEEPVASEPQ